MLYIVCRVVVYFILYYILLLYTLYTLYTTTIHTIHTIYYYYTYYTHYILLYTLYTTTIHTIYYYYTHYILLLYTLYTTTIHTIYSTCYSTCAVYNMYGSSILDVYLSTFTVYILLGALLICLCCLFYTFVYAYLKMQKYYTLYIV